MSLLLKDKQAILESEYIRLAENERASFVIFGFEMLRNLLQYLLNNGIKFRGGDDVSSLGEFS